MRAYVRAICIADQGTSGLTVAKIQLSEVNGTCHRKKLANVRKIAQSGHSGITRQCGQPEMAYPGVWVFMRGEEEVCPQVVDFVFGGAESTVPS